MATATVTTPAVTDAGIFATLRESPRVVKALLAGVFVNRLGAFLHIYLVLFLTTKGFSEVQAGLALGFWGVGSVIGVLIGGVLADRLGVRRSILLSMTGTAGFVLAVLYVRHYPSLLACVAMVSVVGQIYRPASAAMIAELTPQHRRVMIFAIQRFAINLGATVSPLIGAVALNISYDLLFWVQAIAVLSFAAIAASALPRATARSESRPATPVPTPERPSEPAKPARTGYLAIIADAPFVLFLVAFLINSVVYLQYISVLPLAMHHAGLGATWYSAMIALNGFVVISCELLGTKVVQRWPMRVAGVTGFTVLAVGLAVYAAPSSAATFVIGTLIWSLAEIVAGPTMFAYPAAVAPEHLRGRYIGIAQSVFGIGAAIGPVAGVMAWNIVGTDVWLYYGLVCLVGLAAAWFGMRAKGAQPASPSRPSSSVLSVAMAAWRGRAERRGAPPAALTVQLTYAGDGWSLSARRRGAPLIVERGLSSAQAIEAITTLDAPDLHAAAQQVLAEQRALAQAEADRLRAALADVEAIEAEIAAREADLARLGAQASAEPDLAEPSELAQTRS
jgi:predicted MFS family arabinose efflux permease